MCGWCGWCGCGRCRRARAPPRPMSRHGRHGCGGTRGRRCPGAAPASSACAGMHAYITPGPPQVICRPPAPSLQVAVWNVEAATPPAMEMSRSPGVIYCPQILLPRPQTSVLWSGGCTSRYVLAARNTHRAAALVCSALCQVTRRKADCHFPTWRSAPCRPIRRTYRNSGTTIFWFRCNACAPAGACHR